MRLRVHPHLLELAYRSARACMVALEPLIARIGYARFGRVMRLVEHRPKRLLFDCRMCGQCILHSTGMTCPMTCPKTIRNGPCGGVRADGTCEVKPEMRCVWVEAFERAQRMPTYGGQLLDTQPPLDHRLAGTSAWVNMLAGAGNWPPQAWVERIDTPLVGRRL